MILRRSQQHTEKKTEEKLPRIEFYVAAAAAAQALILILTLTLGLDLLSLTLFIFFTFLLHFTWRNNKLPFIYT